MATATQTEEPVRTSHKGLGDVLRHAREQAGLARPVVADRAGISPRTQVKVEQGDPSVAMGSYDAVAAVLNLQWVTDMFTLIEHEGSTPRHYLTGTTALTIPGPNQQLPALWYSSALMNPKSWRIAGRDIRDTSRLLGVTGLWNATTTIAQYGVELPRVWAANHERAVFDLIIHYCEGLSKPLPNVQVSDIDDVVDMFQVSAWIDQCSPFLSKSGVKAAWKWLEGGY